MGIGHEHIASWPKSRRMADAIPITYAVVYTVGEGLAAVWAEDEERADALAVAYQQRGHRAWYVVLEDDGQLVVNDE